LAVGVADEGIRNQQTRRSVTDTVTVRIGGEDIELPLIMNFAALKRCWPAMQAWEAASDSIPLTSASIAFIAALLAKTRPELTQPAIEERLRIKRFDPETGAPSDEDERLGVIRAVREICLASGLIQKAPPEGEARPPENPGAASPSTETGTTSSPN